MLATQQIFLIAALLCLLTFLTLLSVASDQVRGMRAIMLAALLGMPGNILYAYGRELPPLLAYEAANVTYAAGTAALVAGYRILAGRHARPLQLATAVAALGILAALFHYTFDSFIGRSIVVSLFQVAACSEIARTVRAVRRGRSRASYTQYFVLAMCSLVAAGHLGRIGWVTSAAQAPTSLLQPSIWSIAFLTAVSLALPALAIGGLLMAHRQIVVRAEHAGNHDFLTGATSRRAFFDIAAEAITAAERQAQPLALLLIDLDNFKTINDRWGHQAGDAVLRRLVDGARECLRPSDCMARLGGDEFALLLPEMDLRGATAVGARLQQTVRHARDGADATPALTLSIGITLIAAGEELARAMHRADEALYAAKAAGRDQIIVNSGVPLALVRNPAWHGAGDRKDDATAQPARRR